MLERHSLRVEALGWAEAAHNTKAWNDLAARALEPNIYLEPAFALAAAQHLTSSNPPTFIFVWREPAPAANRRLIGVFAIESPGSRQRILRGWLPRQSALGTPLLDQDDAALAIDLAMSWIAENHSSACCLEFLCIASEGPIAELVADHAFTFGLPVRNFNIGRRSRLLQGSAIDDMLQTNMSGKHRKALNRGKRRLQEQGTLRYTSAREPAALATAASAFLALEANGWKGRQQTALISNADEHAFALAMLEDITSSGKCHIDTLSLNDKPIAMGIFLLSGTEAFVWKIAYDEDYANLSPGLQFMVEFSQRQTRDASILLTDSCAIPDHPMFSSIWTDRFAITDTWIGITPQRSMQFRLALHLEEQKRRARGVAKQLYHTYAGGGRKRA